MTAQSIKNLITQEQARFGAQWLLCTKNPLMTANMVNILVDLYCEGLKKAYELGLKEKQQLIPEGK